MVTSQQVLNKMIATDKFSELLGLHVDAINDGYCKLHFTVTADMINGFGVLHGGVTYAAADSAFAFACNSYNKLSVALSCTIDYISSGKVGDELIVEAREVSLRNSTSIYTVNVTNQNNELIVLFKGTAYRKNKQLVEE